MKNKTDKNSVSRRQFIKKSALGIAGAAILPTILPSCSNPKGANDRLLIGHIGVGSRGGGELRGYYLPLQESRSVAICDLFRERREKGADYAMKYYRDNNMSAPEIKAYQHFEELLERDDIDAVNITTTDHWHIMAAIRAAEAGKHVMLAKPLGLSYPNYLKLKAALKKNDVRFHYGTQQRASEHMRIGISMIKEGLIGDIEKVEVWAPGKFDVTSPVCNEAPVPEGLDYDKWIGPAPFSPYCPERVTNVGSWFTYDYSIGFLGGWGAHPLDIMVWGLKDKLSGIYSCEGTGGYWPEGGLYNNIISWDLNLEYESGIKVHFTNTETAKQGVLDHRENKEDNGTTFYGTKGWISLSRSSCQSNIPEIDKKLKGESTDSDSIAQKFLEVIRGERPELCPLDDAIMSDTISHMSDIAIRTGRKVSWNPTEGEVINDPEANQLFIREMREGYTL